MTAVLFDLDGTLLDTMDDLADAANATLAHFGYPRRSTEEVRSFIGNGAERLIRLCFPETTGEQEIAEALAFFKTYYSAHAQAKTKPYPGIPEALAEIKKEFPVAVVSNKPDIATKPLCRDFFGEDIFAIGESSVCPRKPAPDMLRLAMEAIGADRCIYVGDSEVDVLTARNAGVPCLSVLWGFRDRAALLEAGASRFCEKPADLLRKLKEMI
jgi:phosphoglycolate phosphatase